MIDDTKDAEEQMAPAGRTFWIWFWGCGVLSMAFYAALLWWRPWA